ncbi:MAG: hypothetical protein NSGCLCUN01_02213 [uncultured Clostridium sp.]
MNIEKIKEIIKNKKVQAISGAVAGALIIAVAGTMVLNNNNIENKTVTIENNIEDNKEELAVENTVQDKEVAENTDEHIHDENCNHDDENSTSQENNKEVAQNSDTDKQESATESSDKKTTTTTTQTSTTNSNKNDGTSNSNTNKNEHTHSWVEVYKDVYHAEEGHYENVLVKDAWTETVPVYEEQYRAICNTCGADITSNYIEHSKNHMLNGENGSYKNIPMQVQVGTNTITHDAVYEKKWIVDKQAWTEKVLSGYKCNSCGATK